MLKRVAFVGAFAVVLTAWGGAVPVSADLGLFAPAAQACIADLPCDALFAIGLAAAGIVYVGSSDQQKAAIGQLVNNGVTALANTPLGDQCSANGGTDCSLTVGQAINSMASAFQTAIGSGQVAAPITTGQGAALQALGGYLDLHPLPSGTGDGTSDHVQNWGGDSGAVANLANYASAPQVIFYMDVAIPATATLVCCGGLPRANSAYAAAGFSGAPIYGSMANETIYWGYDGDCSSASQTHCPWETSFDNRAGCNADQVVSGCVDSHIFTTWLGGGGSESVGTAHVLHLQVMNTNTVGGGTPHVVQTTGAAAAGTVQAFLYNSNNSWGLVSGSLWYQHGVAVPGAVSIPTRAATMPRSLPVTGGQVFGAPLAGIGSVVANPAATITNVAGVAVPVAGAGVTSTAGSYAGTLTGVADAIASMANTVSRAFDFSRPINWDRVKTPIAAMPSKFPFSIPFDVGTIVSSIFNVSPVTPNATVSWCILSLSICPSMTVAPFLMDTLMPFVRWAELVLLVILAALGYKRWIGGAS